MTGLKRTLTRQVNALQHSASTMKLPKIHTVNDREGDTINITLTRATAALFAGLLLLGALVFYLIISLLSGPPASSAGLGAGVGRSALKIK